MNKERHEDIQKMYARFRLPSFGRLFSIYYIRFIRLSFVAQKKAAVIYKYILSYIGFVFCSMPFLCHCRHGVRRLFLRNVFDYATGNNRSKRCRPYNTDEDDDDQITKEHIIEFESIIWRFSMQISRRIGIFWLIFVSRLRPRLMI